MAASPGANRRELIVDALFDGFPSLLEHREVAYEITLFLSFAGGADDGTHIIRNIK